MQYWAVMWPHTVNWACSYYSRINIRIIGSSGNKEYSRNNWKEIWEHSVNHVHAYAKMAELGESDLHVHRRRYCRRLLSLAWGRGAFPSPDISFLEWLCAPVPSDIARLRKLKHNLGHYSMLSVTHSAVFCCHCCGGESIFHSFIIFRWQPGLLSAGLHVYRSLVILQYNN